MLLQISNCCGHISDWRDGCPDFCRAQIILQQQQQIVDLQHNAENVAEVVVSFSLPLKAILVPHI
jgi:hypothetical protein